MVRTGCFSECGRRAVRNVNWVAVCLAILLPTAGAQAGVVLDPFVGYHASGAYTDEAATNNSYKLSGINYGARLGYSVAVAALGAEYFAQNAGLAPASSSGSSRTFSGHSLGAFAALTLPVLPVRFIATYFFRSVGGVATTGVDRHVQGDGFKAGVHFTFLPLISVGVEYLSQTFGDSKNVYAGETSFSALDRKHTQQSYMVVVSLPIGY